MKQKILIIILNAASIILLSFITPSFLHNKNHEISNNQLVASHIYGLIAANTQRPIGISIGVFNTTRYKSLAVFDTEETNQNTQRKPITKIELSDKINKLIQYSESFDIDGLDNLINELKAFSLPLDFSQKFDNICKSIETRWLHT